MRRYECVLEGPWKGVASGAEAKREVDGGSRTDTRLDIDDENEIYARFVLDDDDN